MSSLVELTSSLPAKLLLASTKPCNKGLAIINHYICTLLQGFRSGSRLTIVSEFTLSENNGFVSLIFARPGPHRRKSGNIFNIHFNSFYIYIQCQNQKFFLNYQFMSLCHDLLLQTPPNFVPWMQTRSEIRMLNRIRNKQAFNSEAKRPDPKPYTVEYLSCSINPSTLSPARSEAKMLIWRGSNLAALAVRRHSSATHNKSCQSSQDMDD